MYQRQSVQDHRHGSTALPSLWKCRVKEELVPITPKVSHASLACVIDTKISKYQILSRFRHVTDFQILNLQTLPGEMSKIAK